VVTPNVGDAHHAGYTDDVDHPLIVGPPVALGIFVVLMLMREAANGLRGPLEGAANRRDALDQPRGDGRVRRSSRDVDGGLLVMN